MGAKIMKVFAAMAIALLASCTAIGSGQFPQDATLYILRHADRDREDLNALGRARSAALVDALEGEEIDAIYTIAIQRNLDTAAPLATARGLEVQVIPSINIAARLLAEIPGERAVWVGNKGNLAEIWEAIGAPDPAPLEYGDLFVVTTGALGQVQVDRRFVAP